MEKEKLTERVQVLLSIEDLQDLYLILNRKSLEKNIKPETVSSCIRKITKKFINENK